MSLPANLSFFMQRLQGVSTSQVKIFPQTDGNQNSGKIIRFELPSNTLLDTRKLRILFNCVTAGAGASMPNDVSSFVERISIYMGGVLVQNGFQGYNTLVHAKAALQGSKCGSVLSHPEIVRKISYHDGTSFANTAPEAYAQNGTEEFAIDHFEGLLGSLEPSIIDTGLFPQITVELTLGDDTVCPISEGRLLPDGTGSTSNHFDKVGSASPTYTLSQMTLQVEVLGMATSVLDQIVEQRIASVGYLSLPFKNYYSFASTHVITSRINVNSASWDRLWLVYRPATYTNKSAPVIVNGYKKAGAFVDDVAGQTAADIDIGLPQYDSGGVFDTNKEKYISNYFNFKETKTTPTAPAFYHLQVNSANIPAYRMTTAEAYAMSKGSVQHYDKDHKISLDQYKNNYFVQCYRFCLDGSEGNRLASGLDTRSVSAMVSINTDNLASCNLTVFAETTAELRVGSGRAIEVIN